MDYIGECQDLRKRTTVHRQQINDPRLRILPVSEHIANCSTGNPKFLMIPFFKMKNENLLERGEKEKHFIISLKPSLNR